MKYTDKEFVIEKEDESEMIHKRETFRKEAHPDKALHITLISAAGVKDNKYKAVAQRIICGDEML